LFNFDHKLLTPGGMHLLLRHGIERLTAIEREMCEWMEAHKCESVEQLKGSMSQRNYSDPNTF